ncbi:hypothetical protein [Priestia sp. FSL R5-0680]|uniref:hypothetical protein n=1 Tax=Priestia sp. FSL R5-0680 TaxID=2921582 RepID=UPI0030F4D185
MKSNEVSYFLTCKDEGLFIGEAELELIAIRESNSNKNTIIIGKPGKAEKHLLKKEIHDKYCRSSM